MDNFDLRKYLAEGRLLKEEMSYDDMKKMVTPFLDLAKSKGWVWNSKGDSWFSVDVTPIALYHSSELPTTKDGEFKGQPTVPNTSPSVKSVVNSYSGKLEDEQGDVVMATNRSLGDVTFSSKDKSILDAIAKVMANDTKVIVDSKEVSSNFTSAEDFEPVKYFKMTLRKK